MVSAAKWLETTLSNSLYNGYMQAEIEAKFLDIDHDDIREKLKVLGATCEKPMQLMRRQLFDYPDSRFQKGGQTERLRIRDEGDKVMVNFKSKNETNYVDEIETTVGSYEKMSQLFEAIGLIPYSFQESKRETWHYKDVEVVLDEWPWLNPYIEIEGPSETTIRVAAQDLGFDWSQAKFGSVDTAYRHQYLGMVEGESIGDVVEVRFNQPVPKWLEEKSKK